MKSIFNILAKKYLKGYCAIFLLLISLLLVSYSISCNNNSFFYNLIDCYNIPTSNSYSDPEIAIIIDDFGQNRDGVKEMMEIDRHLTFAIMPFLTFSKQDANRAYESGYEVIVHLPMQSTNADRANCLGPRPIKLSFTDEEIRNIVLDSIDNIPHAVGVNIHMGAKSSENEHVMTNVMKTIKGKGLYFVDSRTSQNTVCDSVAKKVGIRFTKRDIFLEHLSKRKAYIKNQLYIAGEMAIKKRRVVVIGHVGSEGGKVTAESIKEVIPELESKGIKFVYVSELLN